LDNSGNAYVADANNNRIRKISSSGVVSTVAGTGAANFADGTAATAKFFYPTGVAVDASSNLYVVDQTNHLIRKITPAGVVSTLAGTAWVLGSVDGTGPGASFNYPISIAVDTSGYVYVADTYNHLIRKITPAGVVSTLAGIGGISGANDGTGLTAKFNRPCGVAADNSGNLYVTDYDNHLIRKISSSGVVSTLAGRVGVSGANDGMVGTATFNNPLGIALDTSGNLYVADYNGHLIRKISNESVVSKIAGSVGISGFIDGTGGTAKFANPTGLAVDAGGHVYVADSNSHSIRKISPI
jgi:sugar lactone lactonase YvrE